MKKRELLAGTKFSFGGTVVKLEENATISFEGSGSEGHFAAMLLQEGEQAFEINKRKLRLLYNRTNGALLPLEDQTLSPEQYKNLEIQERMKLGITDEMIQ